MNKHLTNNKKNLFRGITGLAVAGLAGGFMSAGSVAAAGTEICMEPGPNGIPRIVECPPTFELTPLPGLGAPEVNLGGDIDYGAIIDYVNNRDNNDSGDTSDGSGFGGVEIPSADDLVDPDRFAPLEPNLDVFEQDNPFLGTDDDAEPELAQPEAQPEIEVQPEAQPEPQPEIEVQPEIEAQPEIDSTDVGITEVAPEEETTDTVTPEAVAPEAVAPEVVTADADVSQVTTRVVAPTVNIPNTDSNDTNVDADADREIIEAAPVEVLTTDDTTTGGANLGLYAGLLLILGGGGSLAAIAATRRNRD
jgi:pilus assembly protein FimV